MPVLMLRTFVVILAVLATIHAIGEWIIRRKRQKRSVSLKGWIQQQVKRPTVIYRKVEIRLAQQRESD